MALTTYDNLKTAIADHLDRDDLSSHIDDFIDLAEARHKREVRIREMITRSSLTVDSRYESLPTGYLEGISLRLLTSPVTVLTYVNPFEMTQRRSETTGKPTYFTSHTQLEFDKAADQSYSGEILFYKSLTALSASDTSNDLLTRAPDAYLYGALLASAPFLLNDERMKVWGSLYEQAVESVNALDRKTIGPKIARAHGPCP